MALAAEAGELLELFQWLTDEQSRKLNESDEDYQRAKEEIDIMVAKLESALRA